MRTVFGLAASLWLFGNAAAQPPAPSGQKWVSNPALSDEFNDGLDETKWLTHHPYWDGREKSEFRPENITVSGGYLRLSASVLDPPHGAKTIGAACLSSRAASAGPGYYEARLKASQIPFSNAFWFQNTKSEIDVVEAFGVPKRHPDRRFELRSTLHAYPHGWGSNMGAGVHNRLKDAVTSWHVYGVWWRDPRSVWIYLDGVKVAELAAPAAFTTPMYLFFDTELFGDEGTPTPRELRDGQRNTMLVDWVRAYRLEPVVRPEG
jgi:beta-glucanase (GH16 family)